MARMDAVSKRTAQKIEKLAEAVLRSVKGGQNPFVEIPIRSLANVRFNEKKRVVELGGQRQKRYFFNV
jgi:DNA topoisomerase-6 subunit A